MPQIKKLPDYSGLHGDDSRRKQGFDSPWERQKYEALSLDCSGRRPVCAQSNGMDNPGRWWLRSAISMSPIPTDGASRLPEPWALARDGFKLCSAARFRSCGLTGLVPPSSLLPRSRAPMKVHTVGRPAPVPPNRQALRDHHDRGHHQPRLRGMAQRLRRRRQNDPGAARPARPPLRDRRDRQGELALPEPRLRPAHASRPLAPDLTGCAPSTRFAGLIRGVPPHPS